MVAAGIAAGAPALGGCVIDVEGYEAVEAEEHVFAVDGVPDVDLSTFDGRIEVRGWDRSEVRVVVEKRAANRERLEEIEIETEQIGDRVRVAVRRRDADGLRVTLSLGSNWRGARLIASVPHESNLHARTDDGRIAVTDVSGTIELATDDGRIRGAGLRGAVRARTDDGSVRLEEVDADVAVHTEDGSIRVSGVLAGLEASTDDGRIVVGAAPGSVMSGDWDLHAEDGRVTVDLPDDFSALLDLATDDGRIRVDDRFGGNAERGAEALRRVIGGGGFVLRVRTDDGSIRVGTS
ncbi:MAG: DUF4097 family beta strand repeat-containing protein [Acidobacteria bacterium]|nr:DUF4097 family beta strand repeat-containing protein [Acidobacteriota bacterium]